MQKLRIILLALSFSLMAGLHAPVLAHHHNESPVKPNQATDTSTTVQGEGGGLTAAAGDDHADHDHGDHAHGEDGKKKDNPRGNLLDVWRPDFGAALWNLVIFLATIAFLAFVVWPKILNGLRAREEKMIGDLSAAENSAKEAAEKLKEYEAKLAAAAEEARAVVDQARLDAEQLKARLTSETEADIEKMKTRAAEEIKLAQQQAIQDLYASSAQLASAVAGKLIQREITATDTEALVNQTVAELGKSA